MNKQVQDAADAARKSQDANAYALRNKKPGAHPAESHKSDTSGGTVKTVAELTDFFENNANAKTYLKEEKTLRRDEQGGQSFKKNLSNTKGYNYSMCGHVQQCVEKYLELANKQIADLRQVGTPCIDDHDIAAEELVTRGALAEQCSKLYM